MKPNNCFAASSTHVHTGACFKAFEGADQWACCHMFREVEKAGVILATETGYSVTCQCNEEFSGVLMDLHFCPFCGVLLPTVNKSGDVW